MPISTRTPEGEPLHCPICGAVTALDVSNPVGDALCPACGHLLWEFRDAVQQIAGLATENIVLTTSLQDDFDLDSLTVVELVMELEDRGLVIDEENYAKLRTVRDVVEYLRRRQTES